jgi:hypothetical protein
LCIVRSHLGKHASLAVAVVVVLSSAFIRKKYPMEELQLLLEWQRRGSQAVLLPVFHQLNYQELSKTVERYQALPGGDPKEGGQQQQWWWDLAGLLGLMTAMEEDGSEQQMTMMQQWVKDLKEVQHITGFRNDQVILRTEHSVCTAVHWRVGIWYEELLVHCNVLLCPVVHCCALLVCHRVHA